MNGSAQEPLAEHERYMARALELAERGRGSTTPNPLAGCVIVRDNEIIGEGWHQRAGEAHAEINALKAAKNAKDATVYVTLEPCSHHGRTPPCTDALIAAGVRRVVIASGDPNPRVNGQGIKKLSEAGIRVISGVFQEEAQRQNEVFRTVHLKQRPFVLYKSAMTLDGKIATRSGQSRWITGCQARELVQLWRSEMDAIAVGINTVLLDDPLLTCRLEQGKSPVKVIFDSVARTPLNARLFEDDPQGNAAKVIIFVTEKAATSRVEALRERGAELIVLPEQRGRTNLTKALDYLHQQEISSILLEGGGNLAWSFFAAQAVDKVAIFIGPKLLGGTGASPLAGLGVAEMKDAILLTELHTEFIAGDLLISGRVNYPQNTKESTKKEEVR